MKQHIQTKFIFQGQDNKLSKLQATLRRELFTLGKKINYPTALASANMKSDLAKDS